MQIALRQTQIAQELLGIEDPQERLAYIVDRARRMPRLTEIERISDRLVPGCLTKVWLKSEAQPGGICEFRIDSESAMVRGLAALVAEVYSGAEADEIVAFECEIFEMARLDRMITPTRLFGLGQLQRSIRRFGEECRG